MSGKFKPCAYYSAPLREIKVVTKDCSYTAERMGRWGDILWENHRPWYAPWKKCVGFSLYCPAELGLRGEVAVAAVLDRVTQAAPRNPFGGYRRILHRLARGLTVRLP